MSDITQLEVAFNEEITNAHQAGLLIHRIFDPELHEDHRDQLFQWFQTIHRQYRLLITFAIPTLDALKVIASFHRIIEIGAGSGYWAALIAARGAEVIAYDMNIQDKTFFNINIGGPEKILEHPDSVLFLCWPDESPMAAECLRNYLGSSFLFIGETFGRSANGAFGLTGNMEFHLDLAERFHEVLRLPLPNWPGCMDCLVVYKRSPRLSIRFDHRLETMKYIPVDQRLDDFQMSTVGKHLLDL